MLRGVDASPGLFRGAAQRGMVNVVVTSEDRAWLGLIEPVDYYPREDPALVGRWTCLLTTRREQRNRRIYMRGAILHAPGDVRYEERPDPMIIKPTDAIVRTVATCICGSDLWPYRGIDEVTQPWAIGHEYCGIVEQVGSAVTSVKPG